MDLQSILGYQRGSPYAGNPYLDINTPTGLIDMSNTPIDLIGIDNKGNKKKMKAGRRNPYKFEGDVVREYRMQQGGAPVFQSQEQINARNANLRALLARQNEDPYFVLNAVEARKVGDPIPQYIGDVNRTPTALATSLPSGVTPSMVEQTREGYGYFHPQQGTFVPVDPNAIFSSSMANKKQPTSPAYAQNVPRVVNPFAKGGFTARDLYNYLFAEDDNEGYEEGEDYDDNPHTAPTEVEIQGAVQAPEPDEYEIALQMAMGQDELMVTARSPFVKNAASVRAVGTNPYTPPEVANITNPTKYAFEFFQKKGLPPHISAGIVGNLMQESGNFRPDVISDEVRGDKGMSHGIAQWQKDRWPAFLNWASSQGKNPKALDTQLEYVYVEANQRGDLGKVATARTSSEAANIFAKYYERPAVIDKNRARNARQLFPD